MLQWYFTYLPVSEAVHKLRVEELGVGSWSGRLLQGKREQLLLEVIGKKGDGISCCTVFPCS